MEHRVPYSRISAKELYMSHRKYFDKFAELAEKYEIDTHQYVKFFINDLVKFERDIDSDFISRQTIERFICHISAIEKRRQVYDWFMKSVNNLARYCVENEYPTAKEGFSRLIRKRLIGPWYICGKISRYFLCSLPGFKKLAVRLDEMTKLDMQDIVSKFDIYSTDINEAFLYIRNRKVNPFSLTDEVISEIKSKQPKIKPDANDELFDPNL